MQKTPVLFYKKEQCCGCGACLNKCPREAITMVEDECGFRYPQIDMERCIFCGRCLEVCGYQFAKVTHGPLQTLAVAGKNRETRSAAGDVFTELAVQVLLGGGYVCGASLEEGWNVKHVLIHSLEELPRLQGAKYIQSDTGTTFAETKELLGQGETVLYLGTPCQIAGLTGYLKSYRQYDKLITMDVLCHGAPNNRMYQEYRQWMEEHPEEDSAIYEACRDQGLLYRENCYRCKYMCEKHPADISIGEYVGIEVAHPEYFREDGWESDQKVSLVMLNTKKGAAFWQAAGQELDARVSDFEKAAAQIPQLRAPAEKGNREAVMCIYAEQGWDGICKVHLKE